MLSFFCGFFFHFAFSLCFCSTLFFFASFLLSS
ncbi:Uncharacterised protein [Vibrio cholerae]|nr:Uncharacterised protein [Vibrio cholerae]